MTKRPIKHHKLTQSRSGDWLGGYPDPALVVRADGTIVAVNARGAGLAEEVAAGRVPEIMSLIGRAERSETIAAGPVTLVGDEAATYLEVTVLPGAPEGAFTVLARDVTMERNLRPVLVESRQRYKDLVEVSSDFAWEIGPDGSFVFVSPRGALGYAPRDLLGRRPEDFVVDAATYRELPFLCRQPHEDVELWMRQLDDSLACVEVSCRPLYSDDGAWLGARGVCRDVTHEREREAAFLRARHREQLLNYIVGAIRDEVDPANMLTAAAAAATRAMRGAGCQIFRAAGMRRFVVAAEYGETEGLDGLAGEIEKAEVSEGVLIREFQGHLVLLGLTQYRGGLNGAICIWRQAGCENWTEDEELLLGHVADQLGIAIEQIINHERILSISRTDALTGLLNRRAFYEQEMPRHLRRLERSGETGALFYVDLDNFKWVNDTHGHQYGDEVLLAMRNLLSQNSRPGDLIARLGGDEFVIWMDGVDANVAENRAESLARESARLRAFSGNPDRPLGVSVGVAVYDPKTGEELDDLLARADVAMYEVKHHGKGGYVMAPAAGEVDVETTES